MTETHTVELRLQPNPTESVILVDGVQLTSVRAIHLYADADGGTPKLEIETPTVEIDIARVAATVMGQARLILAPDARYDLIRLGWVPVNEVQAYRWTDPGTGQVAILHPHDVEAVLRPGSRPQ